MSFDIHAEIIVGLTKEELPKYLHDECEETYVHDGSGNKNIVCGITVASSKAWMIKEIDIDELSIEIYYAKREFLSATGLDAKIYILPVMW